MSMSREDDFDDVMDSPDEMDAGQDESAEALIDETSESAGEEPEEIDILIETDEADISTPPAPVAAIKPAKKKKAASKPKAKKKKAAKPARKPAPKKKKVAKKKTTKKTTKKTAKKTAKKKAKPAPKKKARKKR
jgi:septal ring-binding cell division protein DamX